MRKSRARVSAAITRAATTSAAAVLHTFDGFDDEVPLHTTHSRWFHTRVTISFGTLFLFLFGTSSPLTRWSGDEYLCKPQCGGCPQSRCGRSTPRHCEYRRKCHERSR